MEKYFKFPAVLILLSVITFKNINAQSATTINTEQLLAKVEQLQAQHKDKIDAAFKAMEAVQKTGAYIESLSDLVGNGELTLPVGIKKGEYELIIQKIKQNKETGRPMIFATCAFQFKENGQKIAFEGSADIEGKKGLGTHGYLELIAPVRRDLGKEAAIVFNSGTRANFGCDGIESYKAKIDVIVTSAKIVAVDKEGKPTGKPLASSFDASFYDFDNYTASFSFNQFFTLKGLKDIIFSLKGASLDQSDTETSSLVKFPEGYLKSQNPEEKNLWKGIAITEASIALPAIFKKSDFVNDSSASVNNVSKKSIPDRIEIGLNRVLIDENGFTGNVTANNIMNKEMLNKSKWDIAVSDFMLSIEKNELNGFGFGGDLNIPPLGENSVLPYLAKFNPSVDEYEFQVNVAGEYDFPVLRSTLSLNETSTLEIMFKESDIYPTLNANGLLTIDAPINKKDSTKKFTLPDVSFENLRISRAEPYVEIRTIGVSGDLKSPKVAGFELSISDIRSFENNKGSGLAFDAGIKLSSMFGGKAGLQLYGNYAKWEFDHVGIDKINVNFQSGAYKIKGGVWFKNGDEVYGSGFRGDVEFTLIDKFNLDAVAVFGRKDDYRYFLTDVFYETSPTSGIKVPPALSFYGLGGGIYKHMQQSYDPNIDSEFGKALSGINYVPDNEVGMGFMASTKFGFVASASLFNAQVGFEMQFNKNGGLNFIQLRGDAALMNGPEKFGKLADNINKSVKKLEQTGGKIKLAAKSDLKVPENKSSGFLTASLNIKYDLANKVFSADMSAYLNAGFIKGIGENDRMGWASAYFSPDKWYTYIGTPEDRLGVEIMGLARADGYFMIGDDIPELPAPPYKVLKNFSKKKQEQLKRRDAEHLTKGSGLAFGQSFGVNFDAKLPPFYAKFGVGMGAEFLLKNYGASAYCAGSSSTLGINGWYARAQAWAWVEADIGLEAKLFGSRKKFSILDISASALLAGAGPNPFYFTGAVGGRFSVMGGLISGQCNFDFEIGEECIIMGGSPFGEEIIAQLTPATGDKEVNVFASPQALFNIPVGLEMEIEEHDGKYAWYKVTLEEFSVYYSDTKQKVQGYTELGDDGKIYMLDPSEPFESQKDMVVYAKVGFKRKLNGEWIYVKGSDGKPVYEEKEETFISGERPKEILPEHVKYSYPIANQYNFYPEEHSQGYVLVSENYAYLLSTEIPEGYSQTLKITDFDGNSSETSFTYKTNSAGNDIRLEIDFPLDGISLSNDEIYKLALVNVPNTTGVSISDNVSTTQTNFGDNDSISVTKQQAEGTLDMLEEKEIYALHFRTSNYNTFEDKMAAISNFQGVAIQEYPHVYNLGSNIFESAEPAEMFDVFEGNSVNYDASIVRMVPKYENTPWYKRKIAPLMYENDELLVAAGMQNLTPPDKGGVVKAVLLSPDKQLDEPMIESNSRPYIAPLGAINYRASYFIDRDFIALQNELANKLVTTQNSSNNIAKFLRTDNIPDLTNGKYELQMDYTLPGKNIVTSSVSRTIELKDFIDE